MKNQVFHWPAEKELSLFHEYISKFGSVKEIVCFQYNANFIFSLIPGLDNAIHLIIQNEQDQFLMFSSLACGYYGEGPRATAAILEHLGVAKSDAEKCFTHSSIRITFSEGRKYALSFPPTFFGNSENDRFPLNSFCNISVGGRRIIMVNPQEHHFPGLLHLLHLMEPTCMDYLMGKSSCYFCNNTWTKDLIEDHTIRIDAPPPYTDGVNLMIYGKLLDVWCLVDRRYLAGLINAIMMYMEGITFLPETNLDALSISCKGKSKRDQIVRLFQFMRNRKTVYRLFHIPFLNKKIDTWKLL